MPTIRDVAKLSGVSISTVSRVMNTPEIVSDEKRKKVKQAILELGYTPNALARGLIYKQTHTVGVLIPDISNNYASELVKGLEDAGHRAGISLIICNTDRDPKRMVHYFEVLKQKQVDGIVFTSEFFGDEYARIAKQMRTPLVLAATRANAFDLPTVKIDDEQAGFDAVKYLVQKGHSDIVMISGPEDDLVAGLPRYQGFWRGHRELLARGDLAGRVEFADFRYEGGYKAMQKLYHRHSALTAVFCASDEMALGAISFLAERGLNVPGDISVLGFDNTKIAKISLPKLTTVAQPIYDIGREAMEKLNRIVAGKELTEITTHLRHRIVERDSVKAI
ncbi:MAG TPA: LacI family transcriptional regulator [Firmicutes bacterium]|nr:LacI family transcriptional regulator [Bacillota bacterium]